MITNSRVVVITGMGALTPLGHNLPLTWSNLINSQSGIKKIPYLQNLPSKIGGTINTKAYSNINKISSDTAPFVHYALAAADEAITDSKLHFNDLSRVGVSIGTGLGAYDEIVTAGTLYHAGGYRRISPFFISKTLLNSPSSTIAIKYSIKGPIHSITSACATGAQSIGDAARYISSGYADVMIAGGCEQLSPLVVAGFTRFRSLSTRYNNAPHRASRPFDRDRDGFVLSEGAAIMILEDESHAIKRGAHIYAKLIGYSITSDGYHITQPNENGQVNAMGLALREAKLNTVDYINAHAPSTQIGDLVENNAIKKVFPNPYDISISSTKGATGHMLGATGALEACFSVLSIRDRIVPPTLNLFKKSTEFDLNYTPMIAQNRTINSVLSNSFGFGGVNACLVFNKY